jgi:hypothetical protein
LARDILLEACHNAFLAVYDTPHLLLAIGMANSETINDPQETMASRDLRASDIYSIYLYIFVVLIFVIPILIIHLIKKN